MGREASLPLLQVIKIEFSRLERIVATCRVLALSIEYRSCCAEPPPMARRQETRPQRSAAPHPLVGPLYNSGHLLLYPYVQRTWENPTAASFPHLIGQPSSFRTLPRFLLILQNVPVGSRVKAALLSQSEGVGNVACLGGILPKSRL